MIDINLIRESAGLIRKNLENRGHDIKVLNEILQLDERRSFLIHQKIQPLREERNKIVHEISLKRTEKLIERATIIKNELQAFELDLKDVETAYREALYNLPNIILSKVPIGDSSKFKIIKKVGVPKKLEFTPKDHLELGEKLDIIDVVRASKVSGARFAYLKNEGALLELALIQFAMDKLIKEGFGPIFPPMFIKQDITKELGYWNAENSNNYYSVNNYEEPSFYLIGTAEHSIVPMHKDEIFDKKDLPKRYAGFSSAFRREAGTYGKDTRGILRVHQFDKVEMVSFVKPEDDEKERQKLLSLAESFMQDLDLPYQLVRLASGDLAFPTAETIDIETWIPSQNKYRETHSISTTTDFQARRLNIKYKDGPSADGEKKFVHILNGTAFAIGRTIIAILENYQQKDGSVLIPKILQKYLHFEKITPKK